MKQKNKTILLYCPKCKHIDADGCCDKWEKECNNIYVCTSFLYNLNYKEPKERKK